MSALHRPNPAAAQPQGEPSFWESITGSPVFPFAFNTVLFAAGVAFIQSPLMESLVPQL